ncbi:MAG: hypothetical protein ACSHYB_03190 [Roseibacillus sp.]
MKHFLFLLIFGLLPLAAQELELKAANRSFDFVDQKNGIGNSCGPASLLNAFGSGEDSWQRAYLKVPGTSDRARIASVIKSWGQAPSTNLPNRLRWQLKGGINFADLAVIAEEMRKLDWKLPKVKSELFFATPGKDSNRQLQTAHKRLRKSFQKGLPPILSIRRFVLRNGQWQSMQGHFVLLTAMPERLTPGTSSFPVEFVDPFGAKTYRGTINAADENKALPCLILICPSNPVGKSAVRAGEATALGFSGAIGAW